MIKEQLNVLINLAASDRSVGEHESKVIHMIGKSNGIPKEEIDEMLKKQTERPKQTSVPRVA